MKICVFGAGAVGGNLAFRLARAGADVSVIARGAHLAAMRERGITVTSQGQTQTAQVRATDDAHTLGPQDAVIVALKAVSIAASARAIASLIGDQTLAVFAVNGLPWWYRPRKGGPLAMLDPGGAIAAQIPRSQTIGGVIHVTATIKEPGHVVLEGGLNALILGEPDGGSAGRLEPLVALLRAGGVAAKTTDSIGAEIWRKLAMNQASSPLASLTGAGLKTLFAEPAVADAARNLLAESAAIARAEGFDCANNADDYLARAGQLSHKTSMALDLENGREIEMAAILEAPLEVARRHGVPAPTLSLVTGLLRAKVATQQS